jgi:tetratricopeptide (TPR) repeat protein
VRGWARLQPWLLAAALALATAALYWPVTRHDFVNYDDPQYITQNVMVQQGLTWDSLRWSLRQPVSGNWHPVTMWSHMLDCQLYHLNPWGHHLTSLLLHALNAALVFLLLHRLTGARWRSACVAAAFAWHPLHVESVAWLAERKDVLSAAFGWLALILYVRYAQGSRLAGQGADPKLPVSTRFFYRSSWYWLAWLCFALGLLSKPMLVTWPCVMLWLDYWPLGRWQRGRIRALLVEKIPFFMLAVAGSVMTFWVQQRMGAVLSFEYLAPGLRAENALMAYCRYLGKLFWPVDLAVFYPHPGRWPVGEVLLAATLLAAITAWVWRVRRQLPFLAVGWFWFVGTLVPVIGLVQVGMQAMADRYTYIPSVGVLIMIVWGAYALASRWRVPWPWPAGLAVAALAACATLTESQLKYWQDSETLFRHALRVTADNDTSRINLGVALLDQNQLDAATREFQAALRLRPASAEAHNDLGDALSRQGEIDAAMAEFQAALRCQPNLPDGFNNLGTMYLWKGQTNEAIPQFQAALRLRPDFLQAHFNLGNSLATMGRADEAVAEFQTALRLQPDFPEAHCRLGDLLILAGRTQEALGEYQETLRHQPHNAEAHENLGQLLAESGQTDAAIKEFQEAIRWGPDDAQVHYKLGTQFAKKGLSAEAIGQFREAVHLQSDFAEARNNLGRLLAANGRTEEALEQFQAALRSKPDYVNARYNLGNVLLTTGQVDAAIREFQALIQRTPDWAPAHYSLGVAWNQKDQAADAMAEFRAALRLQPNDAAAHDKLGILLGNEDRIDEAIAEFQAALRLKPDDAEARLNLARAQAIKDGHQ